MGSGGGSSPSGARMPVWVRVVPFFFSAFLFLSAFFSVFSPLPLLVARFESGRRWMALAFITNGILVYFAGGAGSLISYSVFILALVLVLSEALLRFRSLEKASFAAFLGICAAGMTVLIGYAVYKQTGSWAEFHQQISALIDRSIDVMVANMGGSSAKFLGGMSVEEFKDKFQLELPAALSISSLVLIVLNLVLLLRMNPRKIAQELGINFNNLRYWRAPEFLIWPTILMGVFLLIDLGRVSDVAQSVFKFLMAIYALQGLSILSFFFDLWQVRGFFRTIGFVVAVVLMMPLLLSLGFFDLWFDFRSKFRHS
ncbi:MAG: hypothetical protein A2070_11410 [Bdellovibrionales bacterium GWC1_52_8]|nr:MAG: hypothetical protein A2X97_05985 [Bdellovibrionales bacterium GWA1_52_35]OFZ37956.1 MAG: hypothetical protein A2070_11410 [Bdellovibrionales bacterium GWC1_52_8]